MVVDALAQVASHRENYHSSRTTSGYDSPVMKDFEAQFESLKQMMESYCQLVENEAAVLKSAGSELVETDRNIALAVQNASIDSNSNIIKNSTFSKVGR